MDAYFNLMMSPLVIAVCGIIGFAIGVFFLITMQVDERERGTFIHFLGYIVFPLGGAVIGAVMLPIFWFVPVIGYGLYGLYLIFKKFGWQG